MNPPLIQATGLCKSYDRGAVKALRNASLTVHAGEIIALLGPNGAGKSTLIDIILGLITPTSGSVSICGRAPRQAVAESRVGAVLQTGGLLPELTVTQTLTLIAATHRHAIDIDSIAQQANLTGILHRRVGKCSGGEQQRVRFALALMGAPELLILDEPTTGMDITVRHAFWDSMRAQAAKGTSIIFATHYLEEAEHFAERVVMLSHGQVIADGSIQDIQAAASGTVVECTIDASELHTISPSLHASHIEHIAGRTRITADDTDHVARQLLTRTGASQLRITSQSLDDAFTALTQPLERLS